MKNYKTINIIATIIALFGVIFQIYNDAYVEGDNNYGTLIFMVGLFISIVNQFFKDKSKKEKT